MGLGFGFGILGSSLSCNPNNKITMYKTQKINLISSESCCKKHSNTRIQINLLWKDPKATNLKNSIYTSILVLFWNKISSLLQNLPYGVTDRMTHGLQITNSYEKCWFFWPQWASKIHTGFVEKSFTFGCNPLVQHPIRTCQFRVNNFHLAGETMYVKANLAVFLGAVCTVV